MSGFSLRGPLLRRTSEPMKMEKQAVIEVAQQSYLPRKVNYYVNGSEKGLDELARSFGVTAAGPLQVEPYKPVERARSRQLPGFLQEEF